MLLKRIRNLREDNDLKQIDLAKLLQISQAQYSRIETGENDITLDSLIRLAIFYNTSIDYILELTNEKKHMLVLKKQIKIGYCNRFFYCHYN